MELDPDADVIEVTERDVLDSPHQVLQQAERADVVVKDATGAEVMVICKQRTELKIE